MLSGLRLLIGLLVLLLLASLSPVRAQTTTGSLRGIVKTEEGQPVDGAVVQARSAATGEVRRAVSDNRGNYRVDALPPGEWTIVATLTDGRVSDPQIVQVGLQASLTLNFTVGGATTERVTVLADSPLIDPLETTGKLRVSRQQADALPMSGRVFTDLAALDSSVGAAAPGNYTGERGAVFNVNGQSGRSNTFLVDGLDNNDQTSGTTVNSFYSQQVIEELVLMTHQYSPEFGRASGGVLNIVTRRGTNDPGWQFFIQGGAGDWNSSGSFVDSLPDTPGTPDSAGRFQTGANIHGPIKKDKAFFFLSYEHQEADDIAAFVGTDRDGNEGGRFRAPSRDDNLFLRTDINISPTDSLMVRLSFDDRSTDGVNVGGLYTPEWGFEIQEQDLSLAASITSSFSPKVLNEARLLVATSSFDQFANSDRPGVTRPSGIFGGNNLNEQIRDEDRVQLVENVTLLHDQHTMKFGLDIAASNTSLKTKFNPNGNLLYDYDFPFESGDCDDLLLFNVFEAERLETHPIVPCPGVTGIDDDGDGVIDEPGNIYSFPTVFSLIEQQPQAELRDTKFAVFAQDRWKVNSKLVLDYGLRYDVSTYTLPEYAVVESIIPNGGAARDDDNIAPRFGFSYAPRGNSRLVIRGGGGVFYDKLVLGFPAVSAITSGTKIALSLPQGFAVELTEDTIESEGIENIDTVFLDQLTMQFSTGTELETPYTVQFTFGLQKAIGQRGAFQVDLTRARGHHIPLMVDLNPNDCLPSENPDECPLVPVHRDPDTGSIAAIVTEGESWYSALELGYRWQKNRSWLSASYTWSKAEDLGFDPLKNGISLPPDSDNLAGERGRADGDRRHRLVLSGNTGLGVMGLMLSGVARFSTGLPFNVTTGQDSNLDGILTERPDGVGRNTGADTPLGPINDLRDELNEVLAQTGDEPLPEVESLTEPSFAQIDLRLYRPFPIGSKNGQAEAFLQVTNLFDRENAALIEGRAVSRSFGRTIALAGPPRLLELGFKIGF